ncbi:ubiquitin fusion degradation protein [Borealophlyctis nickersoniae]|nr:ubiquitin fusion degradation protein [Borealophlyctis nickersoniae]
MFGGQDDGTGFFNARSSSFSEVYRCYSIAMMQSKSDKEDFNFGGKIFLPTSALGKLVALHIDYPMLFELNNDAKGRFSHAGVLEFIAEEGRVYLPRWMMQTLLLEEGSLLRVTNTSLPLGTFVKIQPQSVDFLDITDPRAVLEQSLRKFTILTKGDIISIKYNNKVYDLLVLETKPATKGISIVETDLEVDFAPPVGYKEPEPVRRGPAHTLGSSSSIEEHTVQHDAGFAPFKGSGQKLSGKASTSKAPAGTSDTVSAPEGGIPGALRLPPGKMFFGYPVVPLKKDGAEEGAASTPPSFGGSGQTLRAAKRGPGSSAGSSSSDLNKGGSSSGGSSKDRRDR